MDKFSSQFEASGSTAFSLWPGSLTRANDPISLPNDIVSAGGVIEKVEFLGIGGDASIRIYDYSDPDGKPIRGGANSKLYEFTGIAVQAGRISTNGGADAYSESTPGGTSDQLASFFAQNDVPQRFESEVACPSGMVVTVTASASLTTLRCTVTWRPLYTAGHRKRANDYGAQSQAYVRPVII